MTITFNQSKEETSDNLALIVEYLEDGGIVQPTLFLLGCGGLRDRDFVSEAQVVFINGLLKDGLSKIISS